MCTWAEKADNVLVQIKITDTMIIGYLIRMWWDSSVYNTFL